MDRRCLMIEARTLQELDRDGPALRVKAQGRSRQWFPLRRLSRVLCVELPGMGLDALAQTARDGIPVTFFAPGGSVIAQLTHPGALPAPLTHWLEASVCEPELKAAYQDWLDNQRRHAYGLLGCMGCDAEHAADKAEAQLARLARQQRRGRMPAEARQWLEQLLMTQIQAQGMRLGLSPSSTRLMQLCQDLLHPGLMMALTAFLLRLPIERVLKGQEIARYYERALAEELEVWIERALYVLSTQLERRALTQDAPRHGRFY